MFIADYNDHVNIECDKYQVTVRENEEGIIVDVMNCNGDTIITTNVYLNCDAEEIED